MNKVKCPKCGSEQIVALEKRPDNQKYDVDELYIKDLPIERDRVYVGVKSNSFYAIARCLNDKCKVSFLVEKSYRSDPWTVQIIRPLFEKIGEGVPPQIDEAYIQARICLEMGCPDASIAMCRASLDRMTKEKEAKGKVLKARLDDLVQRGILKSSIVTESINVREFGNAALHDLLTEQISNEDAEIICEFTKSVLYDIYVTPYLAAKAEKRRKQVQGKNNT
jgi:hypothetical protein